MFLGLGRITEAWVYVLFTHFWRLILKGQRTLFRIYINKKNIWIRFVSSHQDINYLPVKLRSILSSDHHQSFSCEVSIQTEKNFQFLQIFFQDSLQIISTKRLQMFRHLFKNCHSLREEIWFCEGIS